MAERNLSKVEELIELSDIVTNLAEALAEEIRPGGTAPQWHAVTTLRDAGRHIHSAAGWLALHEERYGRESDRA